MLVGRRVPPAASLLPWLGSGASVLVVGALALLGLRALVTFDHNWDAMTYHLPFAALRGGGPLSFDMNPIYRAMFDGFPPLADLVQGLMWRLTGSINGAQLPNWMALVGFVAYSHRFLRAPFWLVGLIALSAPMVVIHASVAYNDLFVGVLLAIGASSLIALYLYPERASRVVLVAGLLGLVATCWSKYTSVPIAAVLFVLYVPVAWRARASLQVPIGRIALLVTAAVLVAAIPYLRNFLVFGNPMWPIRIPFIGALFPYASDPTAMGLAQQRPPNLRNAPQVVVFLRSLFEIGVPTHYTFRPRWLVSQSGIPPAALRMGGFWNIGAGFYLASMGAFLVADRRRVGIVAAVVALAILGMIAVTPQSNELRYYLFMPLTWAASIGMLFPSLATRSPRAAVVFVALAAVLFAYMVVENRRYYEPVNQSWQSIATATGMAAWWPKMTPGTAYCAVGFKPPDMILLTGPTRADHMIYSRNSPTDCPPGTSLLTPEGIQP